VAGTANKGKGRVLRFPVHMIRPALIVVLVLLAACSSSPREQDRPLTQQPPPRLEDQDLVLLAHKAGEDLAATTSVSSLVGKGPLGIARISNLIPWRELRDLGKEPIRSGFEGGCNVSTIGHVTTWSLAVDLVAFVHRASEGTVSVEYSIDFLLIDGEGGNPWTGVVTQTVSGGKGEVETQSLTLRDLDIKAEQAALAVDAWLKEIGTRQVHVFANSREPGMAPTIAFEDRLRKALVQKGLKLSGHSAYTVELEVSQEGIQRETGAERWKFVVELSRSGIAFPSQRWEKQMSRSSGD
jgi:hypothetical protein